MASIFSRIVAGEIPCHKVWEDESHLAFLDVRPVQPGHTLVIPKREVDYLLDLTADENEALWRAVRLVSRKLQDTLSCRRICLAVIGWEVPHVHVHLIPTNAITDFPWPGGKKASDADLARMAERLARAS